MTGVIGVDFNDVEQDGRMVALLEYADAELHAGDVAILRDADGNVVTARVVRIFNEQVELEVRWPTWNRANTLIDSWNDLIQSVQQESSALDELLEGRPTDLAEDELPRPTITVS